MSTVTVWTLTVDDDGSGITTKAFGTEAEVYASLRVNYYQDPDEPAPDDDGDLIADLTEHQGLVLYVEPHAVTLPEEEGK